MQPAASGNPELPAFIEVTPQIFGVACNFGDGGIVYVYILKAERPALVDTGVRASPEAAIGPTLERLGLHWADLAYIINTHGHWDHMGGNEEVLKRAPQARVLLHPADLPLMQSLDVHLQGYHGAPARILRDEALMHKRRAELEANIDAPTRVDGQIQDGQVLDLGGMQIEFVHVPGHSDGICALRIDGGAVLISADAAQARGSRPKRFPLIFNDVDDYHNSQRKLAALQPHTVCLGHAFSWRGMRSPVLNGDEARAFLAESAEIASELEWIAAQADSAADFAAFARSVLAGSQELTGHAYEPDKELPEWATATLWQYWQRHLRQ